WQGGLPDGAKKWREPCCNRLLGRGQLSRIHQPRRHAQPHSTRSSRPAKHDDPQRSPWPSVCPPFHARMESLASPHKLKSTLERCRLSVCSRQSLAVLII